MKPSMTWVSHTLFAYTVAIGILFSNVACAEPLYGEPPEYRGDTLDLPESVSAQEEPQTPSEAGDGNASVSLLSLIPVGAASEKKSPPSGVSNEEWLKWWEDHADSDAAYWNQVSTWWAGGAGSDNIDKAANDYQTAIKNLGHDASPREKAEALLKSVHDVYAPKDGTTYVCRHYARLLLYTAKKLGFEDVEYRAYGLSSKGHCWNRITISGKTFVLDPRNSIIYEQK
jgi:hypothetical protein